jgi:ABC-2 type transport system permease protein
MGQIWCIGKREFASYFNSPIAYVSITVFLLLTGFQFFSGFFGAAEGTDFFKTNEATVRPLFEGIPLIFAFFLPAVTMRLLSEEKKSGTIELLFTMPVTEWQVVLGKYLAAVMFMMVSLGLTLAYPITVAALGNPDVGPIIGGYFGLLLVGSAYLAIGLMTSTWTRNQIVAFILGASICFLLYFVDTLAGLVSDGLKPAFSALSFRYHFDTNFARGVLDTRDVFFFVAMSALALMISRYILESRKWKA